MFVLGAATDRHIKLFSHRLSSFTGITWASLAHTETLCCLGKSCTVHSFLERAKPIAIFFLFSLSLPCSCSPFLLSLLSLGERYLCNVSPRHRLERSLKCPRPRVPCTRLTNTFVRVMCSHVCVHRGGGVKTTGYTFRGVS